jgi:hypothetical protein
MNFLLQLSILTLLAILFPAHPSLSFSFSEYEREDASTTDSGAKVFLADLRCPQSLKRSRIATMIGEDHRDDRTGRDGFYGSLVDDLNHGFRQLGLKTYTSAEINAQVARAEQEAFLNNDPDAAISAADRLSADFMLKGIISTRARVNRVVNVEEVFVTINLALYNRSGRQISSARASETAFSDADVTATIQKLVKNQSSDITYQLFRDYCKGGN